MVEGGSSDGEVILFEVWATGKHGIRKSHLAEATRLASSRPRKAASKARCPVRMSLWRSNVHATPSPAVTTIIQSLCLAASMAGLYNEAYITIMSWAALERFELQKTDLPAARGRRDSASDAAKRVASAAVSDTRTSAKVVSSALLVLRKAVGTAPTI